jgi:hypothetical protein
LHTKDAPPASERLSMRFTLGLAASLPADTLNCSGDRRTRPRQRRATPGTGRGRTPTAHRPTRRGNRREARRLDRAVIGVLAEVRAARADAAQTCQAQQGEYPRRAGCPPRRPQADEGCLWRRAPNPNGVRPPPVIVTAFSVPGGEPRADTFSTARRARRVEAGRLRGHPGAQVANATLVIVGCLRQSIQNRDRVPVPSSPIDVLARHLEHVTVAGPPSDLSDPICRPWPRSWTRSPTRAAVTDVATGSARCWRHPCSRPQRSDLLRKDHPVHRRVCP